MLKRLRQLMVFFKPPVFPEDEEKSRKAAYANSIALAFSIAVLVFELFLRLSRQIQTLEPTDFVLIGLAITGIISWWLIRKGYVLVTSILLVALIWAGSNGIAASGYGIRDTSFIVNIVVMLIAALLLGWRAAVIVAVASAGMAFGLAYAETRGTIVTSEYPVISFAQDFTVVLGLSAFFIYIMVTGLEKAIVQSKSSLMELAISNAELNRAQLDLKARSSELVTINQALQKRTLRLRVVAEVARTITAVQSLDQLLPLLTNIISRELGVYHAGIFLMDETRQFVILRSANTDGGLRMLTRGHRLKVGEQGIVGFAAQTGKPRVALDVGQDAVFFNNPELPDTHSELALPLKAGGSIIGVLDLQSVEANAFEEEDVELLEILADQVAITIQNSLSYEQAQRALHEARAATSQLAGMAWEDYTEKIRINGYRYDGIKPEPLKKATKSAADADALTVPVQLRGQTIGRLRLKSTDASRKWTEDELSIIESTADRVALAIDSARLLEDAQKRAAREAFLSELAAKFGTSFQLESILRDTVEELGQTLKGSTVTFQLVDPHSPPRAENPNGGSSQADGTE